VKILFCKCINDGQKIFIDEKKNMICSVCDKIIKTNL